MEVKRGNGKEGGETRGERSDKKGKEEGGNKGLVLRDPLRLPFPVRLLQGTADEDVPQERALILLAHAESPDLRLQLVKGADHRFSEPRELGILSATLEEVCALIGA